MQDTTANAPLKVLEIAASGRNDGSVSRRLSADLIAALEDRQGRIELTRRDLGKGLPFVDEAWINANFTPAEERNAEQRAALAESDALVAELKAADVLVIGTPIYNFGVPAALKAWVDMVARARLTFRYTENGPKGLLEGKKAYVIVASGGVPVDSAVDFATPYLRHALSFIGITDVDVIAADRLNSRQEESIDAARMRIAELIHTAPRLQDRVA
jgi:FMN-dependent NADH-azoreductase